jgi:hypothetical protein
MYTESPWVRRCLVWWSGSRRFRPIQTLARPIRPCCTPRIVAIDRYRYSRGSRHQGPAPRSSRCQTGNSATSADVMLGEYSTVSSPPARPRVRRPAELPGVDHLCRDRPQLSRTKACSARPPPVGVPSSWAIPPPLSRERAGNRAREDRHRKLGGCAAGRTLTWVRCPGALAASSLSDRPPRLVAVIGGTPRSSAPARPGLLPDLGRPPAPGQTKHVGVGDLEPVAGHLVRTRRAGRRW